MKHPVAVAVIVANLLALLVLCFVYPEFMVGPGPLVQGHAELSNDCYACHTPWRGAASVRCVQCHAPADIGVRTTKGVPLPTGGARTALASGAPAKAKTAFHQQLAQEDCMACHSDHAGPRLTQRSRKPFSHELLRPAVQSRCESCHGKPADTLHRDLKAECGSCHVVQHWKPASFQHEQLAPAVLARCESCHRAPGDTLHAQFKGDCGSCHGQTRWKPASFDHDRWFVLDGDHNATCATCHTGQNHRRYTCYGCHEHTPARIRAEHEEEGIRNFENCVECHRSADEDAAEGRGGAREGGRGGHGGRRHDD